MEAAARLPRTGGSRGQPRLQQQRHLRRASPWTCRDGDTGAPVRHRRPVRRSRAVRHHRPARHGPRHPRADVRRCVGDHPRHPAPDLRRRDHEDRRAARPAGRGRGGCLVPDADVSRPDLDRHDRRPGARPGERLQARAQPCADRGLHGRRGRIPRRDQLPVPVDDLQRRRHPADRPAGGAGHVRDVRSGARPVQLGQGPGDPEVHALADDLDGRLPRVLAAQLRAVVLPAGAASARSARAPSAGSASACSSACSPSVWRPPR